MLQIDHLTMRAIGSGRVFLDDFSYTVRGNERTVIIGEDELASHTAQVRNMATKEQISVPLDGIVAYMETHKKG